MEHSFSEFYYCDVITVLITIIAFIIALKRKRLHLELNPIFYFIVLSLVVDLISLCTIAKRMPYVNVVEKITSDIFMLGEFGFYMVFIYKNIRGLSRKKITKGIAFMFYICILLGIIFFKKPEEFDDVTSAYVSLSTFYSISLIIASFFYFYELFKSSSYIELKELAAFWVVTAILFYNCCSLPIYVFVRFFYASNLYYYRIMYSLNFILYGLVYIMFVKAYLCKKVVAYN